MGLGENRHAVRQGAERHRAQFSLELHLDQHLINDIRQLVLKPRGRRALGVIDDELHHRAWRQGQGNGLPESQLVPGRPIPQRTAVTGQGIGRFPLAKQLLDGLRRDFGKLQGIEQRKTLAINHTRR